MLNTTYKPYIILLGILTAFILVFMSVINLWINYAVMELYSYLTITPIVIIIMSIPLLKNIILETSFRKYLFFIVTFLIGAGLFFYSNTLENYADQLIIAGMIMMIYSNIFLFINNRDIYKAILILLASYIMVPIPTNIVFNFSAILTRWVLGISIPLARFFGTTLSLEETGGFIIVRVLHEGKFAELNIAPVCSGIIGLFSVLALAPLIMFISLNGEKSFRRKVFGGVVGIIVFAILMFLANSIRLFMVFYFTGLYGFEVGYSIFHHTPELVLAVPIIVIVIKILDILSGNVKLFPKFRKQNEVYNSVEYFGKKVVLIFVTPLILLSLISIPVLKTNYALPVSIFTNTYNGPVTVYNNTNGLKEPFIPILFQNITISYIGRDTENEKALGPTTRVHLYSGRISPAKFLDIYQEFSQQPSGIHIWELCLWWQNITENYVNTSIYSDPGGNVLFVVREIKYGSKYLNGYLIYWRDKVYTEKGIEFSRTTIMINSYGPPITERDIQLVKKLAENLLSKELEASYAKYSKEAGFKPEYYLSIILPSSLVLALIVYMFNKKWIFPRLKLLK